MTVVIAVAPGAAALGPRGVRARYMGLGLDGSGADEGKVQG